MADKLYTPPPGTYDLPFTWVFDASRLTDGNTYRNLFVSLQGGYGDFLLRRIVGLSRCLASATGQFQIHDRGQRDYLQSNPENSQNADDLGFPVEAFYPELGAIKFDLYDILRDNPGVAHPQTAQIAFQGVRRMKGENAWPGGNAKPKTFTYFNTGTLGVQGSTFTAVTKVSDYPFELHNIIIVLQKPGFVEYVSELTEAIFTQKDIHVPFTTSLVVVPGLNVPFAFTVTGSTITFTPATDGAGNETSTWGDVLAAYNASPAAQALANLQVFNPANLFGVGDFPLFPVTVTGTFGLPLTSPLAALWLYDQNRIAVSSAPLLDLYMDGGPGGIYQDGSIVTPLWYQKDSQIRIDYVSLLDDPTLIGCQLVLHLVGKQYYPC